jgi:hypothetical protein
VILDPIPISSGLGARPGWRRQTCAQFLDLVFAVLGTGLGTERGGFGTNKRDVVNRLDGGTPLT